jgi:BspA type Leucine rich repeat region (6 copies)
MALTTALAESSIECNFVDEEWTEFDRTLKTCIVKSFSNFRHLTDPDTTVEGIIIEGNVVTGDFPENIGEAFPSLLAFAVGETPFKTINGKYFANMEMLSVVYLVETELETIEPGAFDSLTNLKSLYIYESQLTSLDEDTFKFLTNLNHIDITSSQISSLPENLLDSLENLEYFTTCFCQLETLPENFFSHNPNLREVDLWNNSIAELSPKLFDDKSALEFVDLGDNTCVSKAYDADTFDQMKKDLTDNCTPKFMFNKETRKTRKPRRKLFSFQMSGSAGFRF